MAPRAQDDSSSAQAGPASLERCPSCAASLQIAYRYRIVEARGKISGGVLYEAVDDIFGDKVAVLFVEDAEDQAAVDRFVDGNRMFAELGGGRGLVKLREVSSRHDRRPHVVMDWLASGTLESTVRAKGPVDQATLLELIGDLLIGLGKAHRSMPTVVHGHIHPGKIGFLDKNRVVLFGFEYARQVHEQDSHLADAFVTGEDVPTDLGRARDLQQLGVSIFYAATGEWVADKPLDQQRARVQSKMGGPLPTVIDRMLTAGGDGYRSAVEALLDFEQLLEGSSTWKARPRPREQDRSSDLVATPWTSVQPTAQGESSDPFDSDHDDHDHHDDHEPAEPQDLSDAIEDIFASERTPPPPRSSSPPPFPPAHVARRQLHAQAAAAQAASKQNSGNAGKVIAWFIGGTLFFGMCVAGMLEDDDPSPAPPPVVLPNEPIPMPPPEPIPQVEEPSGLGSSDTSRFELQHHTGTITGPTDIAGFEVGERCDVWIEPTEGGNNCRWYIDCGEPRKRIYGGGDVGYSNCTIEGGRATSASDEEQDAPDGSFMASLSGSDPMVMVEDRWLLPPTRVMISIDGDGGPYAGTVPDVPQARRMNRASIESAISRNELPEIASAPEKPLERLSPRQVAKILETRKDALRECGASVEEGTTLRLKMTVLSDGRVDTVELPPDVDADTEQCMVNLLTNTRFPPFAGDNLTLTYPLKF